MVYLVPMTTTTAHATTVLGSYKGFYAAACSCGYRTPNTIAYKADAKKIAAAHVAQAGA